jgi:large subunit ribosomal protein L20
MTRVKRGVTARKRHKRELKRAKGYRGTRSKLIKKARESNLHAGKYAFRDRRTRKREMRKLWIVRINAAARAEGMSYSEFIHGLDTANIDINRKVLADMALTQPEAFRAIVGEIRQAGA